MPLLALIVGTVLLISALRNTQGQLASALAQDVPQYLVWAAAIAGCGAIGFIPGLKTASRAFVALILVVIILRNYQAVVAGITNAAHGAPGPAVPPPATPAQKLGAAAGSSGVDWAGLATSAGGAATAVASNDAGDGGVSFGTAVGTLANIGGLLHLASGFV
jgi:hypothetical protein